MCFPHDVVSFIRWTQWSLRVLRSPTLDPDTCWTTVYWRVTHLHEDKRRAPLCPVASHWVRKLFKAYIYIYSRLGKPSHGQIFLYTLWKLPAGFSNGISLPNILSTPHSHTYSLSVPQTPHANKDTVFTCTSSTYTCTVVVAAGSSEGSELSEEMSWPAFERWVFCSLPSTHTQPFCSYCMYKCTETSTNSNWTTHQFSLWPSVRNKWTFQSVHLFVVIIMMFSYQPVFVTPALLVVYVCMTVPL